MKAIEFFALPVSTLLGSAVGRAAIEWKDRHMKVHKHVGYYSIAKQRAKICAVSLAVFLLILISVVRTKDFVAIGLRKHLYKDLLDVRKVKNLLPPGSVLFVNSNLGAQPFMVSRWIGYLLRDVPLVYAPIHHGYGFLHILGENYQERVAKVTHIIQACDNKKTDLNDAIFRNSRYEIIPIGKHSSEVYLDQGFYGEEGWGRWMNKTAEITAMAFGNCKQTLHINVISRFVGVTGEDAIIVSTDKNSVRYDMKAGQGKIIVPVEKGVTKIKITSIADPKSPAGLGLSDDSRKLSYAIGQVKVSSCP